MADDAEAILRLSPDELSLIAGLISDSLEPRLAVVLSSTCTGLRVPLAANVLPALQNQHGEARSLCAKVGVENMSTTLLLEFVANSVRAKKGPPVSLTELTKRLIDKVAEEMLEKAVAKAFAARGKSMPDASAVAAAGACSAAGRVASSAAFTEQEELSHAHEISCTRHKTSCESL